MASSKQDYIKSDVIYYVRLVQLSVILVLLLGCGSGTLSSTFGERSHWKGMQPNQDNSSFWLYLDGDSSFTFVDEEIGCFSGKYWVDKRELTMIRDSGIDSVVRTILTYKYLGNDIVELNREGETSVLLKVDSSFVKSAIMTHCPKWPWK